MGIPEFWLPGRVTGTDSTENRSDGRSSATVPDHYRAVLDYGDYGRLARRETACGDGRWRLVSLYRPISQLQLYRAELPDIISSLVYTSCA